MGMIDPSTLPRQAPSTDDGRSVTVRPRKVTGGECEPPTFALAGSSHHIMRARGTASIVHAMCVMGAVAAVSGFSQSNTASVALREYAADAAGPSGPMDIPPNIIVPPIFRPVIRAMLQRSVTFRRQCLRIANTPDVLITVERVNTARPWMRAETRMTRTRNGPLLAVVQVTSAGDFAELIGHEFEHIIEQLDGIDLPIRARLASTGVSRGTAEDTYETVRARRVGEIVSAEVRRGGS